MLGLYRIYRDIFVLGLLNFVYIIYINNAAILWLCVQCPLSKSSTFSFFFCRHHHLRLIAKHKNIIIHIIYAEGCRRAIYLFFGAELMFVLSVCAEWMCLCVSVCVCLCLCYCKMLMLTVADGGGAECTPKS